MDTSDTLKEVGQNIKVERLVSSDLTSEDKEEEVVTLLQLRPTSFDSFPGQDRTKENLRVYVESAKTRGMVLDHVLLHGPPGLGKTSLAKIIAMELGVEFFQTSGPAIEKPGDLAGILTGLPKGAVFFIDEIHRLSATVEEMLYSAMEDYFIDMIVGKGVTARSIKVPISPFTLIGATTKVSSLTSPLISRFGIRERFDYYTDESLKQIILRSSKIEHLRIDEDAALRLASSCRGTPRIANRLLRRVRDFSETAHSPTITKDIVEKALLRMEIDSCGLDPMDRRILNTIVDQYGGGPVGIEALSYSVGEERSTIEDVYEPYLVHKGFVVRGARGREITPKGREHLSLV